MKTILIISSGGVNNKEIIKELLKEVITEIPEEKPIDFQKKELDFEECIELFKPVHFNKNEKKTNYDFMRYDSHLKNKKFSRRNLNINQRKGRK